MFENTLNISGWIYPDNGEVVRFTQERNQADARGVYYCREQVEHGSGS